MLIPDGVIGVFFKFEKIITVATKLQHDAGNTAVPAKKKNQQKKRRHRFRKSMLWRRQHVYSLF